LSSAGKLAAFEARLRQSLASSGLEGFQSSTLLRRLVANSSNGVGWPRCMGDFVPDASLPLALGAFYADPTHPNDIGHRHLGEAIARHIARRVVAAACGEPHTPSGRRTKSKGTRNAVESNRSVCYMRADELPIAASGSWRLLNEGAKQSAMKLGLLSTNVSDVLTLGPVAPQFTCGAYATSLGVLRTWRPNQGSLNISCRGCLCARSQTKAIPGPMDKTFPLVQTSTVEPPIAFDYFPNSTMTLPVRFVLGKRPESAACYIDIRHVTWPARAVKSSRVRVDTLALRPLTVFATARLRHRGDAAGKRIAEIVEKKLCPGNAP